MIKHNLRIDLYYIDIFLTLTNQPFFWTISLNHPRRSQLHLCSPPATEETGHGFHVTTRDVADLLGSSEHDAVYANLFRHVYVAQLEALLGEGCLGELVGWA